MKRFIVRLALVSTVLVGIPAAAYAQSINERQESLDRRIDQGVRTGELTRQEAMAIREQFRDLAALEQQYRLSGGDLSADERADLDARFDTLSRRIYNQKHDEQDRP